MIGLGASFILSVSSHGWLWNNSCRPRAPHSLRNVPTISCVKAADGTRTRARTKAEGDLLLSLSFFHSSPSFVGPRPEAKVGLAPVCPSVCFRPCFPEMKGIFLLFVPSSASLSPALILPREGRVDSRRLPESPCTEHPFSSQPTTSKSTNG